MDTKQFTDALASKDMNSYSAWFADDMKLYTPIHQEPIVGKQAARQILQVVFSLFDNFHYPDIISGEQTHAFIFRAEVNGIPLDGVDYVCINETGLVTDFYVMMRPLKAITELSRLIGIAMQQMQKNKPV